MRYLGIPLGLWALFAGSFRRGLRTELGLDAASARTVTSRAGGRYRRIVARLPDFERGDRFAVNLVSCAMLGAFVLELPERPGSEALTAYYAKAMMTPAMRWYCRRSGKDKFTPRDIAAMRAAAALRAADRNPYSWNMDFVEDPDGSGYEARFTHCGICVLMEELGLCDLTPALCRLDYTMSEAGGTSDFVRRYTLAEGGPYCDCGYRKRVRPG